MEAVHLALYPKYLFGQYTTAAGPSSRIREVAFEMIERTSFKPQHLGHPDAVAVTNPSSAEPARAAAGPTWLSETEARISQSQAKT